MPSRSKEGFVREKKGWSVAFYGIAYKENPALCQLRPDFHILYVFSVPGDSMFLAKVFTGILPDVRIDYKLESLIYDIAPIKITKLDEGFFIVLIYRIL